ncbi:MAG TPA: hypothetical protein VN815_17235 [Steroidobacteraceae bacterium]|nr:hypothetical protein [Steroidobacteraceae bacterium]
MSEQPTGPAGGQGPNSFAPKPRFEYKAPSMFWEHRYLLMVLLIAALAGSVYLFWAPHKQLKIEPPAPPPVYVEPIPQRPASSAQ